MLPPPNIPDHWSAEQALAVYDWLNSLCELVWERYREPIQQQYRLDLKNDPQPDFFFDNDDEEPPF
jgi:hypothetical protein